MKAKNYCLWCNSKTSPRKPERSQRCLWGDVFNQSPGRRLRDFQISPLWDVSEMLYEKSQRCIWDASMPAGQWPLIHLVVQNKEVLYLTSLFRGSHTKVFPENLWSEKCFRIKGLCRSLFFNKVTGLRPATLFKKKLRHRCFPVNLMKIFSRTFCIDHLRVTASESETFWSYDWTLDAIWNLVILWFRTCDEIWT